MDITHGSLNSAIHPKKDAVSTTLFHRIGEHIELIAALLSGALILFTWLFGDNLSQSWWVILHLLAFAVGGYAKASEGITETIRTKKLNVEILMILAAIGSVTIGYWTEGAILIFIFALSGALETYSINKSNKAISSLMDLQPEEALLIKDGVEKTVPVSELQLDDLVLVRAGERIAADGLIVKGASSIDESTISGESIPVNKSVSNKVFSGTVALDGTIMLKITTRPSETLFQKIIDLVQTAQEEKSPSQLFIEKFENAYVYAVLAIVAIMMFVPHLTLGWSLSESIYRAMVLLVVASPCALVASISPASLSAISNAARKGILFKGGVHIENLNSIQAIALDKTGTLTNGKPVVTDAIFAPDEDQMQIMAAARAIEKQSTHPLAQAIASFCQTNTGSSNQPEVLHWKNFSGNGVSAVLTNKWAIGKADFVGKEAAMEFQHNALARLASEGKTVAFVKKEDKIVAMFALKDTVRQTTKQAIAKLKSNGIIPFMLTGDNELTAKAIAVETGIDRYFANCLPQDKVKFVKELRQQYRNVAMVGDGINDAPALASANTGIAMGQGTDIALDTADVVLMNNDLSKITGSIQLSSRMNRIVKQNILFSLSVIVLLILSNYFQLIDLPLGVLGHEGSTILVILNGLRLLR
ncbi:heavy metal translocating P-type ATPase [Oceanobacillus massiliensis]|uniref:heavy metal translocating P-type ATPase n=1 Tax=Oceanobacillus massiliensis TaxID=1465765 RepID=UPI000287B215|nr:heavy metal translocating P-type ATPase [Oceanobacillus massiliensis]